MTPRMRVCCETWANGPHTGACNRARRPVLYRPDGRSVTAPKPPRVSYDKPGCLVHDADYHIALARANGA